MNENIKMLEQKARKLRYNIVKMIGPGKAGHYGGSCSVADIIAALYFYKMKHDPKKPGMKGRDKLVLSKGHSGLAQYSAMAECGYFPEEELWRFKKLGAMLQGHPDYLKIPGIEAGTGSLGQGLSIACGLAAAAKLDDEPTTVYCIVGDAETAEGQIWEAATSASFYALDNLVVIMDRNRLCAMGTICERFDRNDPKRKWEAFGFEVIEIDGHNMEEIIKALDAADVRGGKPKIIIANTVKGKGIPIAEGNFTFHNGMLNEQQHADVLASLK